MDAKVLYWTGAWLNMALVAGLLLVGRQQIRRGAVAAHRLRMLSAAWLVVAFVASYLLKLSFLGREALATWDPFYVYVLRVHELCIATMLAAGATAIWLAVRLRLAQARDGSQGRYPAEQRPSRRRLHRLAGSSALYAALLGLATAAVVLYGMYARAGWS